MRVFHSSHSRETLSITEGTIWKNLLVFFFPIMLGSFFQQMYNTVDAIVVGNFVGKQGLAAVGSTTSQIINMAVGFFVGLASGATVIAAQYYGARMEKELSRTTHTAMTFAAVGGAIFMVLGLIFSPHMLTLLSTPEDIIEPATTYMRIYFLGMIPNMIYNIGAGILRAMGDSKRPLFFLIAACFTNVVLDILMVMGLKMGVAGAAWATIISQLVSAVLVVREMCRSRGAVHLDFRRLGMEPHLLKKIIHIGLPSGLESVLFTISNMAVTGVINQLGTDSSAATAAFNKEDSFYWMLLNAMSISITTFVGQNFGARKYDRVKQGVKTGLVLSAIMTVLVIAIMLPGGRLILGLFTSDDQVLTIGMEIVKIIVPSYILYIFISTLAAAMRGTGNTMIPSVITLLGICVVRLIWVYLIVPMNHTIQMINLCYPLSWFITAVIFVVYYLKGKWFDRAIAHSSVED